ncbi:hypothetical protein Zmor_005448 [Zophobas morio]|uniref:Uncharacterized protein n=1 Tax=Zophobas morio TaxID=2755281 RepID=A0AA38MMH6_9CUCU|nr:hypothetical protein Zmor_005448 [Zophobas morio]
MEHPNGKKVITTVSALEGMMMTKKEDEIQQLRNQYCNILTNNLKNKKMKPISETQKFIHRFYRKTRKFLSQNKHIMFTKADKGNITVLMDRGEYKEKMKAIVDDNNTYKLLKNDPTSPFQKKHNDIKKWIGKEYISN